MHGNGSVPKHGLWTRGRDYYLFIRVLDGVRKGRDDTELELFFGIVARHAQKCPLLKLFLFNLDK